MTTAHRRNSNATYPNSHVRSNCDIHARSNDSRTPSVPFVKAAVPRAGFDGDDGGLSLAVASLRLSPVPNHPRTTNSGSSTGSMPLTSSSRFERTNNVPPRHRGGGGGGEKEYTQLGLQSPREKQWDRYFEQQQPPRRQNQQYATGYYNSSKYQLQSSNAPRSQSIPPSPSRSYTQIQPHNPAHPRASTTQPSPLHLNTESPLVSWGSVYPPCSVRHVQLQLQELYQQQQRLGELPLASPFISVQASQQLAAHFTSQQTRSSRSSPSKIRSGHSRPPSVNAKTRVSLSQTHHQQTNPQSAHIISNSMSSVHLLASHAPPLTQPSSYVDQAAQSLHACTQAPQMALSRSLQTRLSELPPLSFLWSDSAANQTLAYLHQTLLNEYDIPARDLTVVHYQRLYDGYFEELERDVQRGEDRTWVMGMALEEDERTAAKERGERTTTRDVEEMEQDTAQDLAGNFQDSAAHVECIYSPVPSEIILKLEERVPMDDETPQTL